MASFDSKNRAETLSQPTKKLSQAKSGAKVRCIVDELEDALSAGDFLRIGEVPDGFIFVECSDDLGNAWGVSRIDSADAEQELADAPGEPITRDTERPDDLIAFKCLAAGPIASGTKVVLRYTAGNS